MYVPRSRVPLGALLAGAALLLTACSSSPAASAPDVAAATQDGPDLSGVVLRVGDQVRSTQTVLEAAGELDDVPYRIEWASFTSGPPLLEALNADAIDVGGVGDTPPVFAQANGARLQIVAASRTKSANDFLLAGKDSGITSVEQLRGHSIAVAQGSSAHGLLLGLLTKADIPLSEVTVNFLAPPDALSAFASGQVDTWAVWNPYAAIGLGQAGGTVVADGTGITSGQGYQLSSAKTLADPARAAALGDFLGRLARSTDWAASHSDEWVPLYAKLTGLPEEVAEATFATARSTFLPIDTEVIAKQQAVIDRFADAGLLKSKPTAADFFDDRFNDDVTSGR